VPVDVLPDSILQAGGCGSGATRAATWRRTRVCSRSWRISSGGKLSSTLETVNWSQTDAAAALRIPLSTLNQKIKRLNIDVKRKRQLPQGRRASSFSIAVGFVLDNDIPGTYSLVVGTAADGTSRIESEECKVGDKWFRAGLENGSSSGITPAFTGDRPALVSYGSLPTFSPVFNIITGMSFYAPNPEKMRPPKAVGSGTTLNPDASNAADVLARLERDNPRIVERIGGYLQSFNPEFANVSINGTDDFRWLAFTPDANPSGWKLNSSEVSDGTLRAIGILLAIFQAGSGLHPISLVGLEEPEANPPSGSGRGAPRRVTGSEPNGTDHCFNALRRPPGSERPTFQIDTRRGDAGRRNGHRSHR
jgi:hypothetical protein